MKAALVEYIEHGGGYVDVCGGANSALKAGLVEAKRYNFQVRGKVWTHLHEHPVTDGYDLDKKVLFPHASGPLFVLPEETDQQAVITFDVGSPPLPTFTHTIARELGRAGWWLSAAIPKAPRRPPSPAQRHHVDGEGDRGGESWRGVSSAAPVRGRR